MSVLLLIVKDGFFIARINCRWPVDDVFLRMNNYMNYKRSRRWEFFWYGTVLGIVIGILFAVALNL